MKRERHAKLAHLAWLGLGGLAIFLLWAGIGHESLGYDESYSLAAVQWPLDQTVAMIGKDSHPPLYFVILWGFTRIFGSSPEAARSLSALGALALIGLGWFPLRRWWGERKALLYGVLCLAAPMTVIMGQDARMYTWAAFFVTVTWLSAWDVMRKLPRTGADGRRKETMPWGSLAVFMGGSIASAYTHHFALMAAAAGWFILFVHVTGGLILQYCRNKAEADWQTMAILLAAGLATAAAYLPWLGFTLEQAGRIHRQYWIEAPTTGTLVDMLLTPWNFKYGLAFPSFILMPVAWGIMVGQGWTYLRDWQQYREERKAMPPERTQGLLLGLGGALLFLLVLAAGYVLSLTFKPVLVQRYMVCAMGVMILGFAWAMGELLERHHQRTWGILALFVLSGALVLGQVETQRFSGAMTEAKAFVDARINPQDTFVHASEHTLGTFAWYYPSHRHYLYLKEGAIPYSNYQVFGHNSSWGSHLEPVLEESPPGRVVWFAFVDFQEYAEALTAFLARPDWTFATKLKTFEAGDSWYRPCLIAFRKLGPGERKLDEKDFDRLE